MEGEAGPSRSGNGPGRRSLAKLGLGGQAHHHPSLRSYGVAGRFALQNQNVLRKISHRLIPGRRLGQAAGA